MTDYNRSVLEVCERLNGGCSGTGDGLSDADLETLVSWLHKRVTDQWCASKKPPFKAYDNAVRFLALSAIEIGRSELRRRADEKEF
jgi:hypothetical protein